MRFFFGRFCYAHHKPEVFRYVRSAFLKKDVTLYTKRAGFGVPVEHSDLSACKDYMDGIIIQARTGSTRLANKILLPFYGELRIIDILIRNIKQTNPEVSVVLATTENPQDDVLQKVAEEHGILCFRGSEDNVLARFIGAAEAFGLTRFIRVCSDNPFLQADTFAQLFSNHNRFPADYTAYGFGDGTPTIKTHLGLFSELTTLAALKRAAAATSEKLYIEHVTNYLYTHPQDFSVLLLFLPACLEGRRDLRFTLDTMEDFTLLQELYADFIEGSDHSVETLLQLVERKPEYREKMLHNIQQNSK